MPALVWASRWVHYGGMEFEVVSARDRGAISARRRTSRRPIVVVDASEPKSSTTNTWQVNEPAAHEVKLFHKKLIGWDVYDIPTFTL